MIFLASEMMNAEQKSVVVSLRINGFAYGLIKNRIIFIQTAVKPRPLGLGI